MTVAKRSDTRQMIAFCRWAAEQTNVSGCIDWPFRKFRGGYGKITYRGVRTSAHRVVLEMATGKQMPPEILAAHAPVICHNRACVNPLHLRWATRSENMMDRRIDGTAGRHNKQLPVGVSWRKGKYMAYSYVPRPTGRRRQVYLGVHVTLEEAVSARDRFESSHEAFK